MSKIVVIHQPDFIPYLGFFHRLLHCDHFVLLDHVQFNKRGWHHRDKVKGPKGPRWLTIPIDHKICFSKINEARINNYLDWRTSHLNIIRSYYRKTKYFYEIFPAIENIYRIGYDLMVDLNIAFLKFLFAIFSIDIDYSLSSSLNIGTHKSQAHIDIVKKIGGDTYLSGIGARDYMDSALFKDQGIKLKWQDFTHPVYPQLYGEFVPCLSSIDLLFNCGIEESRKILRRC